MRSADRFLSRIRDIQHFSERAKQTVADRALSDLQPVELDALCYLILIVSEATIQALALDADLGRRQPAVPWREIHATENRPRHGYATLDLQVVFEVVEKGHIDQLLGLARSELDRAGGG